MVLQQFDGKNATAPAYADVAEMRCVDIKCFRYRGNSLYAVARSRQAGARSYRLIR